MKTMTPQQMRTITGGNCDGLRRLALVAGILGQEEIAIAAIATMLLEGCPL